MERTIEINSTVDISVKADYVLLSMTLSNQDKDYASVIEIDSKQIDDITNRLIKIGFKKEDIKTSSFYVESVYEYENSSNIQKRIFVGYKCTHGINIYFNFNNDLISKVLFEISNSISNPDININFTVKDKEKVKDKLIKKAIISAEKKALLICKTSNINLGKLINIKYNLDDTQMLSETSMYRKSLVSTKMASFEFTPEDIKLSDNIKFTWEII